jgi:hypothetical protein
MEINARKSAVILAGLAMRENQVKSYAPTIPIGARVSKRKNGGKNIFSEKDLTRIFTIVYFLLPK